MSAAETTLRGRPGGSELSPTGLGPRSVSPVGGSVVAVRTWGGVWRLASDALTRSLLPGPPSRTASARRLAGSRGPRSWSDLSSGSRLLPGRRGPFCGERSETLKPFLSRYRGLGRGSWGLCSLCSWAKLTGLRSGIGRIRHLSAGALFEQATEDGPDTNLGVAGSPYATPGRMAFRGARGR